MAGSKYSFERSAFNVLGAHEGVEGLDLREQLDELGKALREDRHYLAVGPNLWARGFTKEQALDTLVRQGGSRKKFVLYETVPGVYVNDMGMITYPGVCQELGIEPYVEIERKGVRES